MTEPEYVLVEWTEWERIYAEAEEDEVERERERTDREWERGQ